jgi:O-antigen/teichoic acid export membrane protein
VNDDARIDDPSRLGLHQRLRFLARDVFVYGGATAVSAAFGLISFPLLARHFSIEDYGVFDFFSVVLMFLTTLVIFGQDSAVARFIHEDAAAERRKQVVSQSLAVQAGLLLLSLPLVWILSAPIASAVSDVAASRTLLRLVILQIPFLLLVNFAQTVLKFTFARTKFMVVSVGTTVVTMGALVIGVLGYGIDVTGVFVLLLLARAACAVVALWLIRDWLTVPRDWRIGREMLPFAIPLGIICAVATFSPVMERALIVEFIGQRDLGLYAAGARVAMLIALPITAFQIAWGPFSLAIHREADAADTYNWVLKAFTFAILSAVLLLGIAAATALQLFASDRYAGASVVVFPIAMGLAIEGIGWITSIGIGISKRTYLNLFAYVAYVAVTGGAVYVLVQTSGIAGAAWGVLLGQIVKSTVETWLAQRAYPLDWAMAGVIAATVCTVIVGAALQLVSARYGSRTSLVAGIVSLGVMLAIAAPWLLSRPQFHSADQRAR